MDIANILSELVHSGKDSSPEPGKIKVDLIGFYH